MPSLNAPAGQLKKQPKGCFFIGSEAGAVADSIECAMLVNVAG